MRGKILFIVLALFILCLCVAFALQDVRKLTLPADGLGLLEVDCGAGFLKVNGVEGSSEIKVEAEVIVDGMSDKKAEEFIQEKLELSLEKKGSKAVLTSKFKPYTSIFSSGTRVINLTVTMPKNMELDVDDSSGFIEIEGIRNNVKIDDSSGDIMVRDITGRLEIDDSSGDIDLSGIRGDVSIDDGSGDVDAEGIEGEVEVDDGSGSIDIRNARGNVIISDRSGSIRVDGVERDVIIKDDGSGSVRISNVKGNVKK